MYMCAEFSMDINVNKTFQKQLYETMQIIEHQNLSYNTLGEVATFQKLNINQHKCLVNRRLHHAKLRISSISMLMHTPQMETIWTREHVT